MSRLSRRLAVAAVLLLLAAVTALPASAQPRAAGVPHALPGEAAGAAGSAASPHGLPGGETGVADVPAGPATLRGRVVHRSRDDAGAGLAVALFALGADGRPGIRRVLSGPTGEFAFEQISNDPKTVYLLGVTYGGISFNARTAFAAGEFERTSSIEIYDTRAESDELEFGAVEIRIDRGCSGARVRESHSLRNPRDVAYFVPENERAGRPPIARVTLPEGATFFELTGAVPEESIDVREGEVLFWGPLHPGSQRLRFAYSLPPNEGRIDVVRAFPAGATDVRVLTFGDALRTSDDTLRATGPVAVGGLSYAAFASGPVAAGDEIAFSLELADFEENAERLELRSATMWLELDDAALDVREQFEVTVTGNGPLRSESDAPLLCLPLPPGAEQMRFSNEAFSLGIQPDATGGLALRGPLPPGRTGFAMSYLLRSGGDRTRFERTFPTGLSLLSIYIADTGVLTETDRMHNRRPARTSDRTHIHLEAYEIDPGETVAIDLTQLPLAQPLPRTASVGFILISALVAGLFLTGPMRTPPGSGEVDEPIPATAAERATVYATIRDLEDDFETGKISADDHGTMLEELRLKAGELLRAERDAAAAQASPATAAPPPGPPVVTAATPATAASAGTACSGCGARGAPGARFCAQCGARLGDAGDDGESAG